MPHFESSGHGDLFVEYIVVLPTEISPQTRRSEYSNNSLFGHAVERHFPELTDVFGGEKAADRHTKDEL